MTFSRQTDNTRVYAIYRGAVHKAYIINSSIFLRGAVVAQRLHFPMPNESARNLIVVDIRIQYIFETEEEANKALFKLKLKGEDNE